MAGAGTYVKGDQIYASLVGIPQSFAGSSTAEDKVTFSYLVTPPYILEICSFGDVFLNHPTVSQRPVVEVLRSGSKVKIPEAGNIVIAKVTCSVIFWTDKILSSESVH